MRNTSRIIIGALSCARLCVWCLLPARGSDPLETQAIAALPGANLSDLYVFPSPTNANNVVLIMTLHPYIQSGEIATTVFDPNVMYQFKIDNTGDDVEDLVIQAKFTGTATNQQVQIAGPLKPASTGTVNTYGTFDANSGQINS